MPVHDVSKQLATYAALDRFGALLVDRVECKPPSDASLIERADSLYRDELVLWVKRQTSRHFTREEIELQCVVALRYADPARPTMRELWHYLQILIEHDARFAPGRRRMRLPAYSTFCSRVADLPRGLVDGTRRGRAKDYAPIAAMKRRFQAVASRVK